MEYKRTIIQLPQRTMSNFLFFVVLYIVAITFNNNKSVPTLNYPNNKIHPPPQKKRLAYSVLHNAKFYIKETALLSKLHVTIRWKGLPGSFPESILKGLLLLLCSVP